MAGRARLGPELSGLNLRLSGNLTRAPHCVEYENVMRKGGDHDVKRYSQGFTSILRLAFKRPANHKFFQTLSFKVFFSIACFKRLFYIASPEELLKL